MPGLQTTGRRRLALVAHAPGLAADLALVRAVSPVERVDFQLDGERSIHGTVLDLQGLPVVGAKVRLSSLRFWADVKGDHVWTNQLPAELDQRLETVTDSEGRFSVSGVSADAYAAVDVTHPDHAPERANIMRDGSSEIAVVLKPARRLRGRTLDESGAAVDDAKVVVEAYDRMPSYRRNGVARTVTGSDGTFELAVHAGDLLWVRVEPRAGSTWRPFMQQVEWLEATVVKEVTLQLHPAAVVRGRVVERGDGSPVADAAVRFVPRMSDNPSYRESDTIMHPYEVRSDDEGRFVINVVPGPGHLLVESTSDYIQHHVTANDLDPNFFGGTQTYHGVLKVDIPNDAREFHTDVELERGRTLRGRVVDESGASIESAYLVSTHCRNGSYYQGERLRIVGGAFELRGVDPERRFDYFVFASDRQLGAAASVGPDVDLAGEQVVVLRPCATAAFTFVDGNGDPVANFSILEESPIIELELMLEPERRLDTAPRPDATRVFSVLAWDPQRYRDLITDDQGRVEYVSLIPDAPYRLVVRGMGVEKLLDVELGPGERREFEPVRIDVP